MSAAARRACVCRSQFLFAVVQWATVLAALTAVLAHAGKGAAPLRRIGARG